MAAWSFGFAGLPDKYLPSKTWEDRSTPHDLDLRELLRASQRQKAAMLAVFLAVLGTALLYLAIAPAHYDASSSILIDPQPGRGLSAGPAQPENSAAGTNTIDSQVKLLSSQEVLTRVIKSENLEHDSEFGLKPPGFLSRLFGLNRDGAKDDLTPVMKLLNEAITIKCPERTHLVEIQVSSIDPVKAANIANAIAQAYIDDQIQSRIESASRDLKRLRERMDSLQEQIRTAEEKVESYKSENRIVTSTGLVSNEQQVADLTRELGFARAKASEAKARLNQLHRAAKNNQLDAQSGALKSPAIERLRTQQADAEREVARLSKTLGARHPALLEAQASAEEIRRLIAAELRRIETSAADDYAKARANGVRLEAKIDRLKAQPNTTSTNPVPLRQLEQEADALRGSYEQFAKIRDNLNEQAADNPPARIVTVARPPIAPSSPRKTIILLLALGGGLCAAMAAALVRESRNAAAGNLPGPSVPPKPESARTSFRQRSYLDDGGNDPGESLW